MEEPIRVLNVTTVFRAAGIESFIMNMYRHIDRSKVQFDFMVMRDEKEFYDDEIATLGGRKYTINVHARNALIRVLLESRELYKFLKKNKYQIVHIHYTTPLRAPYLLAAKRAGVPVRIYHSHSAEVSGKSKVKLEIYNYYREKIAQWGTDWLACSKVAADWMFTKKLVDSGKSRVIYNGIDTSRFKFDEVSRNRVLNELKLDGNYVIAHTGRFLEQKNHKFIIKVFAHLKKEHNNVKIMLLGTGDLVNEIKDLVREQKLEDDVLFLGVKQDVECYLCAADCYLMPSLYEGLPVAAVEAQCAGLPCVFSKNITPEVKLRRNVEFLSLNEPVEVWCQQLMAFKDVPRCDGSKDVAVNGYSIQEGADKLQKFYQNAIRAENGNDR